MKKRKVKKPDFKRGYEGYIAKKNWKQEKGKRK